MSDTMMTAAPGVSCSDLNHTHLRIGILEFYPFIIADGQKNGVRTYKGLSIDLLNIMAAACNFSYTLMLPPDGEYGDLHDGHWTGLIGQLRRKETDLSIAALAVTEERGKAADYTAPFFYATSQVVIREESVDGTQWGVFLRPFHWQVYLLLLAVLVFCLLLMMCMVVAGNMLPGHGPSLSLVDLTELMFGSALQEAIVMHWTHTPLRVFVAFWCLMSLAVSACYTSKLTSLLVDVTPPPPFTSLSGMLERGDFRWGSLKGGRFLTHLRLANDAVKQAVYQGLMTFAQDDPDVLHRDPEVHLAKVLNGRYAFFIDSVTVDLWESEHCEVRGLLDNVLGKSLWAFYTQKNSSLTAPLSLVLLRLHDTGVMSYLRHKWFPTQTGCSTTWTSPPSVTMETMQGFFYLILAVVMVAAGVLLVEHAATWIKGKRTVPHSWSGPFV